MSSIHVDVADYPKKFKAVISGPSGDKTVSFGQRSATDRQNDFPHHGSMSRMAHYLVRHGATGDVDDEELRPTVAHQQRMADEFKKSRKEDWTASGVGTAGFWSRWFLWSFRDLDRVKRQIKRVVPSIRDVYVSPRAERRFYAAGY